MAVSKFELLMPRGGLKEFAESGPEPTEDSLDADLTALEGQFSGAVVRLLSYFVSASLALLGMTLLGTGYGWLPDIPIEALWVANILLYGALAAACVAAIDRLRIGLATSLAEIGRRGSELEETQEKLRRLATTDALTGLSNRRSALARLDEEVARGERYERPVSLLMVDLDYFKHVNDTWGHGRGDEVLRAVGDVLRRGVREQDTVGRVGGEEFLVILPETAEAAAQQLAERLRVKIEELQFMFDDILYRTSASIGLATLQGPELPSELLGRADSALYEAKGAGRNRVR